MALPYQPCVTIPKKRLQSSVFRFKRFVGEAPGAALSEAISLARLQSIVNLEVGSYRIRLYPPLATLGQVNGVGVAVASSSWMAPPSRCWTHRPIKRHIHKAANRPGLGLPFAQLVGLLSLATGAVLGVEMGSTRGKGSGEQAQFRELMPQIDGGGVILVDRYLCTYFTIAMLMARAAAVLAHVYLIVPREASPSRYPQCAKIA